MQRLRANPRPFVLAGVAVAVLAGFFVVVAPLFDFSGRPTAEIAGAVPRHALSFGLTEIDVGVDNTGDAVIDPLCIEAQIKGPLAADHVVFQGLDNVPFRGDRACGGSLNGQETISAKVYLRATGTGGATITLVPTQAATELGGQLTGALSVG